MIQFVRVDIDYHALEDVVEQAVDVKVADTVEGHHNNQPDTKHGQVRSGRDRLGQMRQEMKGQVSDSMNSNVGKRGDEKN